MSEVSWRACRHEQGHRAERQGAEQGRSATEKAEACPIHPEDGQDAEQGIGDAAAELAHAENRMPSALAAKSSGGLGG